MSNTPTVPDPEDDSVESIADVVAQVFLGYDDYDDYEKKGSQNGPIQNTFDILYENLYIVLNDPELIYRQLTSANPSIGADVAKILDGVSQFSRPELQSLLNSAVSLYEDDLGDDALRLKTQMLAKLFDAYNKYKAQQQFKNNVDEVSEYNNVRALFEQTFDKIPNDEYKPNNPFLEYLDNKSRFENTLLRNTGKWRDDSSPLGIHPWQCRIGAATFYVPPVNIQVSQAFRSGSLTGSVLRQPNSAKFNTGHSETVINMTLYFPNHETIWGFVGDTAKFNWDPQKDASDATDDLVIDYYLSSLRGLVTQFKYAPFLPVRNQYLNQTYGINAVTMLNMTVNTMPDYPFCLVVNLEMAKFNHSAYLPMLDDFDQAIHWGKFRQYMGRAASRMDAMVNQGFLVENAKEPGKDPDGTVTTTSDDIVVQYEGQLVPRFDKQRDIADGRYFDLYFPTTTPSRIFQPDTTDFRQPGEDNVVDTERWNGWLDIIGLDAVDRRQYNFLEFDTAIRSSTTTNERALLLRWLDFTKTALDNMNSNNLEQFVEKQVRDGKSNGSVNDSNEALFRDQLQFAWLTYIYEKFALNDDLFKARILQKQLDEGAVILKEWKIPMSKLYLDWSKISIQGIAVSLSNNIVRHQIQMQSEPVHQHIGGGDSRIDVSMIVEGEDNLIRLRRVFEHISGLARLEHGAGVLGFLGIKNVVTALCGIKYVVPLSFEVDTIPNYPHGYIVRLSMVDFDVMQQTRESLSSNQQADLIEAFGKRNPFLRLKQKWSAFNAYPDFPLDVRDENNTIVGHLDPDWYFRSFVTNDDDLIEWQTDKTNMLTMISILKSIQNNLDNIGVQIPTNATNFAELVKYRQVLSDYVKEQVDSFKFELPTGFEFNENGILIAQKNAKIPELADDGSPLYCYLGLLSEDQNKNYYLKYTRAGVVTLGYADVETGQHYDDTIPPSVFAEDLSSRNLGPTSIPSTTPSPLYQREYYDNTDNPAKQFELMMKDWRYRQLDGRMIRAFPTYMLWVIDEGGYFAGIKLFDNFYGLNSVVDFSVIQSEDSIEDTLILRVSNLYQRLSTPLIDSIINDDDYEAESPTGYLISSFERFQRNLISGLTNQLVEINNVRLKPGVRVHLRAGYGSDPNSLQTVFNGVITNVEPGDILTITAQSDAVELTALVNSTDAKGHSGTVDGGINTGFWLSEPRDLMVRLLSMGSSAFKEYMANMTNGVIFSENRFGIRHFGSIIYEPMSSDEENGQRTKYIAVAQAIDESSQTGGSVRADVTDALGDFSTNLSNLNFGNFYSILNANAISVMQAMWVNSFRKRDYEIFKRNIYPGNGLGIAQFMGGDQIDLGLTLASVQSLLFSPDNNSLKNRLDSSPELEDQTAQNKTIIDTFKASAGLSYNENSYDVELIRQNTYQGNDGMVDEAVDGNDVRNMKPGAFDLVGEFIWDSIGGVFNFMADAPLWSLVSFPMVAPQLIGAKILKTSSRLINGPLGRSFGLLSAMEDDDLPGYDEVSFRAQTYMKTVWDLFQTCAALLPNYIVAVRPFEDRSTVFYGKPHWLYTSGVAPLTYGRPKEANVKPLVEGADAEMESLMRIAKQNVSSFETLQRQLADMRGLSNVAGIENPYSSGSSLAAGEFDPSNLDSFPTEWPDGPFLWLSEGAASEEMHLGAAGEDVVAQTGHSQVDFKNPYRKWPYNMDRNGGWYGGQDIPGGTTTWDDPVHGQMGPYGTGDTIGNEEGSTAGHPGAFGPLDPQVEQWYVALPMACTNWLDKFEAIGEKGADAVRKINETQVSREDYFMKKILVYAPGTGKACVGVVSEVGPDPTNGFTGDDGLDIICGLSPDICEVLGIKRGSKVHLRAIVDDVGVQLGPWDTITVPIQPDVPVVGPPEPNPAEIGTPAPTETIDIMGESIEVPSKFVNDSNYNWLHTSIGDLVRVYVQWLNGGGTATTNTDAESMEALVAWGVIGAKGKKGRLIDIIKLAYSDPIIFAYQFGWALPDVPMYISVSSGLGVDTIGMKAKAVYDKNFNGNINWSTNKRDQSEATDVWREFRIEYPRDSKPREIFDEIYPESSSQERFEEIMDMFLQFMWQFPFARGWLVIVADKKKLSDSDDTYQFSAVDPVWKTYLTSNDVTITEAGVPYSAATAAYMQQNMEPGQDSTNPLSGIKEGIEGWWDNNVGQVISMIGDTIAGVISAIRLSLMQTGIGLSQAANMQRQANIFNAALFDSIYYQAGNLDALGRPDLARMADNPFTREYGEPVAEIREPFQRVHFLSSFQHILSNGITESIDQVSTVITAVSDGKYSLTVHFDKSMSPEKQVETVVETGLFWDNAFGSGITGIFQPLIHPLESLRSIAKTSMGSSDLLSARRVALYHLKENLKNIYTGELLVLGNPDIRAHDLIYIADVYERMYGMFEVEKVIHHFTPELGFVTAIVPNALVSINDPGRWSMISWMWKKFSDYNIRNDTRAMLNAKIDRESAIGSYDYMESKDLADKYSTQLTGSLQWTQGNSALIKDLAAMYGTGGMRPLSEADELANSLDKVNTTLLAALGGFRTSAVVGGVAVGLLGAPTAGAAIAAGGYVIGDLLWDGWVWIRDNLLDQHGCYIQYLNKNGQAMDAGLSSAQGVAVGQAHSIDLFPTILGLDNRINYIDPSTGSYRITANDVMGAIGYSEVETAFIQRQISWFVDQFNSNVLRAAGRDETPDDLANKYAVIVGKVNRVIDGDTIELYVTNVAYNHGIADTLTGTKTIRLAYVNTAEVLIKDQQITAIDELEFNPKNDLGRMATEYMRSKFADPENSYVAVRVTPQSNGTIYDNDEYGRIVGVVFHQLPRNLYNQPDPIRKKDALAYYASKSPFIPWDSYMEDGRPYTLNWEIVMAGYGNVDVRDSIYDSPWRDGALGYGSNVVEG